MKKISTLLIIILLFSFKSYSQLNIEQFVEQLKKEYPKLKKKEKKNIRKFMKIGYKEHADLFKPDVQIIPLYRIYPYKKYAGGMGCFSTEATKDSLFYYCNLKNTHIEELFFYKEDRCLGRAIRAYSNVKRQDVGRYISDNNEQVYHNALADLIFSESPDLVFCFGESDFAYFFLKGDDFFCYNKKCGGNNEYKRYNIKDFIDNCLNDKDVAYMIYLDEPEIYIYSH